MMRWLPISCSLLLALSAGLAPAAAAAPEPPASGAAPVKAPAAKPWTQTHGASWKVSPAEVVAQQAGGSKVVIVDVRAPWAYQEDHIYGAANIPLARFDAGPRGLPKDRWLVLYCSCPDEHASLAAAKRLHDRWGYQRLAVLKGGLDAWQDAGYQVVERPPTKPAVAVTKSPTKQVIPTSPMPTPSVQPSFGVSPSPMPVPSISPMTPPDQLSPMDERRGTTTSP